MSSPQRRLVESVAENARVSPIELFFDLVFVFALTQVTALMAEDLSPWGVVRGLLVLALLWWCWVGYAYLGNLVRADEGLARVAMFAAMVALFLLALSIPEAFDDLAGGLVGPVVVAAGYFAVRAMHLAVAWVVSRDDPHLRRHVVRFGPSLLAGTTLLLVASQLRGTAQTAAWAGALAADYGLAMLAGASGLRLDAPGHFAERHALILIVALGESIVAIGVGVAALPVSWPILLAATLGLTVAACVWWAYFDVVALVAERSLRRAQGDERSRLARTSYTYLHLPMITGVVLLALGLKKVLEYVGNGSAHSLADPLEIVPLAALYGGVSLYLLAHVAFRLRTVLTVNVQRTAIALALLALLPLAARIPALAALAVLAAVTVGLISYETLRFADVRDRVRHDEGAGEGVVSGRRASGAARRVRRSRTEPRG